MSSQASSPEIDAVVHEELRRALRECGKDLRTLSDDDRLDSDLGFASMEVTMLLTRVSARLGLPGSGPGVLEADMATVGDLLRACRAALYGTAGARADELDASRQRAAARRATRL